MSNLRSKFCLTTGVVLLAAGAANLWASPWNKLTRLEVHETIQVPGATLTPGKYVMKLHDSMANRHIVQFFNEDQSQILATVLAIPNEKFDPADDTQLRFYETRGNEPPALRMWFYPGETIGREFVYPQSEASVIAQRSGEYVPTMDDASGKRLIVRDPKAVPVWTETRLYVWSPAGKEATQTEAEAAINKQKGDKTWIQRQREYRRYYHLGEMNPEQSSSARPGAVIPTNLSGRMAQIETIMRTIEKNGDQFEKDFQNALSSSTVQIKDRDKLKAMVDEFEDSLDELEEEYKENDLKEAHEKLRRSLEVAAGVNRFMLRSEFGEADASWANLRDQLNQLASMHTFPELQVLTLRGGATAQK